MKTHRKLLCMLLILVLAVMPQLAFAGSFTDTQGHWAEKNIEWGVREGYLSGYPDGTFKPDAPISKAEYYRITNQFIKKNTQKLESTAKVPAAAAAFGDVKAEDWFYDEVQLGLQAGYLAGDEGENLNPTEAILREEAIWIFAKNQDLADNVDAAKRMKDFDAISAQRQGLVGAAIEKGIVKGNEKGEIMAKKTLTRAEVVTMIAQFLHPDGVPGPDPKPNPAPQGQWHWSFDNSKPNFTQGYKINPEVLGKFSEYFSPSDASLMRKAMRQSWHGSCYGMTATSGLYKEGRLKTSGLNTPNQEQISVIQPQVNYNAQSMINIYQLSQHTRAFNADLVEHGISWRVGSIRQNTDDLRAYADQLKRLIDQAKAQNTTVQLAYFWEEGGHANAIYDYVASPGKLVLQVYDPNFPGLQTKEVVLDLNRGTMTAVSATNAGMNGRDINVQYSYASPTSAIMKGVKETPVLNEQALVLVEGNKTVTITSGGESWTLDPSQGLRELDSDVYVYYIPKRDTYTVKAKGALNLTIAGQDYSAGFETANLSKAVITPQSVNIEGQSGDYLMTLARDEDNSQFKWNAMEVAGKDGGRLGLTKEDFGFTLRGDRIQGATLTGLDKFQETGESYNGQEQMVQIRQEGNRIKLQPNKYGNYDVIPDLEDPLVGSWIGRDYVSSNSKIYDAEATLFITKNPNGSYKVVQRVEVVATGKVIALEYNPVRFNQDTKELELRRDNCRVLSGEGRITGANKGPVYRNGRLQADYEKDRASLYTRF